MLKCKKDPAKVESMASLLILGGVIPLAFMVVYQYGFYIRPCMICMLETYPYYFVVLMGILSLLARRTGVTWRWLVALGIAGFITTGALSGVHAATEQGYLHNNGGCFDALDSSFMEMLAAIQTRGAASCAAVAVPFLGVTLAVWNTLWAMLIAGLMALQYRHDMKYKQQ